MDKVWEEKAYLKGANGRRLEAEIRFEVLSDFTNQSLERKLSDQKLGRFLVSTDFTKSDGTGSESVRLLDSTSSGLSSLPGLLRRELFTGCFSTSGLTSRLL
jgi:hypothetical protein